MSKPVWPWGKTLPSFASRREELIFWEGHEFEPPPIGFGEELVYEPPRVGSGRSAKAHQGSKHTRIRVRRRPTQRSGAANGARGAKQRGTHAPKRADRSREKRSGQHVAKRAGVRVGTQRSVSRLRTWDESQRASLRDPREARGYLNATLASDEHELLLVALRNVAEAHGWDELSAATGIGRARLRRLLSVRGKLDVHGLCSVLRACGLTLGIVPAESAG